jgi:hypothetical protein
MSGTVQPEASHDKKAAEEGEERMHAEGTGSKPLDELITSSPQGDVEYDREALEEAEKRMHAEGSA